MSDNGTELPSGGTQYPRVMATDTVEITTQGQSYSINTSESLDTSTLILLAIAKIEECSPEQLTPRLSELIDSDALDALFDRGSSDSDVTVSFSAYGYRITVGNAGRATVTPLE